MLPPEEYKHLLPLSITLIIFGLSFLIWKWPHGKHLTFSRHAARHRSAIIYYLLLFTLVLPLLLLFFLGWFAPTFQLSYMFIAFIIGAIAFQYSVCVVPETTGWKANYHVFGASVSAAFMWLALAALLFAPAISTPTKVVALVSLAIMSALIYIGSVNKIQHPNLLALQASYYAAFFTTISYATCLN